MPKLWKQRNHVTIINLNSEGDKKLDLEEEVEDEEEGEEEEPAEDRVEDREAAETRTGTKSFLEVLRLVLPPPDRVFIPPVDSGNAIEQRHILIYGGPGSGKTNAFRYLAVCMARLYGRSNLHVAYSDADLKGLLEKISPDSPVQLLCCEDMTRVRQDEDAIHGYFTIRHLMAKRTGSRHGLIVTAFTTHDLYGVQPKSLRTNCDLQLFLETPANPYDERLLLDLLGEEIYRKLQEVEKKRLEQPEYKGWIAYAVKWDKGLTYIPKSNFNLQNQNRKAFSGSNPTITNLGRGRISAAAPVPVMEDMNNMEADAMAVNENDSGRGGGGELSPFHEVLLAQVWKGFTSIKALEEQLYNVHPDEIEQGLEELEALGYLRLQGPRSRILGIFFRQDWLLTSQGINYIVRKGGKIKV
jgi:hypothetical protein